MYAIVHHMDDIMRKNTYFKRQQDAWHPLISRLYFGIIFYLQTVKSEVSVGIASHLRKSFYLAFIRDYPLDNLPVPGPLVTLFKSLNPAAPGESLYGLVSPTIPETIGPKKSGNSYRYR